MTYNLLSMRPTKAIDLLSQADASEKAVALARSAIAKAEGRS